jgi:hypothetical protein
MDQYVVDPVDWVWTIADTVKACIVSLIYHGAAEEGKECFKSFYDLGERLSLRPRDISRIATAC